MSLARYLRDRVATQHILEDLEAQSPRRTRSWRPNSLYDSGMDEGKEELEFDVDDYEDGVLQVDIINNGDDNNDENNNSGGDQGPTPKKESCPTLGKSTGACLVKHHINILFILLGLSAVIAATMIFGPKNNYWAVSAGKKMDESPTYSPTGITESVTEYTVNETYSPTLFPTIWSTYAPAASPTLSPNVGEDNFTNINIFEGNVTTTNDLFIDGNFTSNETTSIEDGMLESEISTTSSTRSTGTSSTVAATVDGVNLSPAASTTTAEAATTAIDDTTTSMSATDATMDTATTSPPVATTTSTEAITTISTNEAVSTTTTVATTTATATTSPPVATTTSTEAITTTSSTIGAVSTTTIEVDATTTAVAAAAAATTTTANPHLCAGTTSGRIFKISITPTTSITSLKLLKQDDKSGEYKLMVANFPTQDEPPLEVGTNYRNKLCVLPGKYKFVIKQSEEACYDGFLRGNMIFDECGDGEYDFEF